MIRPYLSLQSRRLASAVTVLALLTSPAVSQVATHDQAANHALSTIRSEVARQSAISEEIRATTAKILQTLGVSPDDARNVDISYWQRQLEQFRHLDGGQSGQQTMAQLHQHAKRTFYAATTSDSTLTHQEVARALQARRENLTRSALNAYAAAQFSLLSMQNASTELKELADDASRSTRILTDQDVLARIALVGLVKDEIARLLLIHNLNLTAAQALASDENKVVPPTSATGNRTPAQ